MVNNTYQINGTNPIEYSDSLEAIGNKKHKLWNGFELAFDDPNVKTNSQIFIKDDLHFYRTDYEVGHNILLKFNQEDIDKDYVDFRINNLGRNTSIIQEKVLELKTANKKEKSFHVFLKREILGLKKDAINARMDEASKCPLFNKISEEILSIPATGNSNALKIEGKMLEMSYALLEHLHKPKISRPSFLSCDYKLQCLYNAKVILKENYVVPPTITSLSKTIGINSNQLKVGFKHLFGTTIRQYVIQLRLQRAQHLILNTQLPLGIISNKVGYINHGHFSKLYKETYGLSPLNERRLSASI